MNNEVELTDKRYRNFMLILYPDDNDFDEKLMIIKSYKNYAYIKHEPESDEKKVHYHCIISLENATTINTLGKKTLVPTRLIEPINSLRAVCRYLIHLDNEDKKRYDLKDVTVSRNFERKFLKQFDDIKTEQEIIMDIYTFIDNMNDMGYQNKLKELIIYVNLNCYDTIYKRYRSEFLSYMSY